MCIFSIFFCIFCHICQKCHIETGMCIHLVCVCIFFCIFCILCILIFHLHILAYSAYSTYLYLAYSTYCAYFAYFTCCGYVFQHYMGALIGDMHVSILHIVHIEHIFHILHIFYIQECDKWTCKPHPSCNRCPFPCPAAVSCSNVQYRDNTAWDVKRISRLSRRFLR